MSKAKKVIFVIVEGPTDKDALSSVLKQIFSSAEVHFHVIYGDITTEDDGGRIVVRFKYEQSIQDTVKALHTG